MLEDGTLRSSAECAPIGIKLGPSFRGELPWWRRCFLLGDIRSEYMLREAAQPAVDTYDMPAIQKASEHAAVLQPLG